MNDVNFPYPHDTDHDIFRESLAHSEATTGFTATLIEKDYYCSLVLHHFFKGDTSLVFKGGTCLSKVYTGFYRLSEDLDLIIPVTPDISRDQRRIETGPVKRLFNELPAVIPGIMISEALRGHNESRQYIGKLEYRSSVIDKQESIKIEVGIREPLLKTPVSSHAHTIAVNPFSSKPLLPVFTIRAMAVREAYAEKVRAALTRKEPAIRDLFDLSYAVREMGLDFSDPDFLGMVRAKLRVPGNFPVNVSADRKHELDRQLKGQLKPVLRSADFIRFRLDEAFDLVHSIAEAIST